MIESPLSPEQEASVAAATERIESRKAEAAAAAAERSAAVRAQVAVLESEKAERGSNDPWTRAVDSFREKANEVPNIHSMMDADAPKLGAELAAAEAAIEAGEEIEAARDYDPAAVAETLALETAVVEQADFRNSEEVREAMSMVNAQLVSEVSDEAVGDFIQSLASSEESAGLLEELRQQTIATIDSWESPIFGNSSSRDETQTKACADLWSIALKSTLAAQARGLKAAPIDAALARARVSLDADYRPGHKEPKPAARVNSRPSPINVADAPNIHSLQWG